MEERRVYLNEGGPGMKRAIGILLFLLCLISIYVDLTYGTLPSEAKKNPTVETSVQIPYKEVMVRRGDTVLSIMEREGGFPGVQLEQMVHDFSLLNGGLAPEEIRPGNIYKFPVYNLPDSE